MLIYKSLTSSAILKSLFDNSCFKGFICACNKDAWVSLSPVSSDTPENSDRIEQNLCVKQARVYESEQGDERRTRHGIVTFAEFYLSS